MTLTTQELCLALIRADSQAQVIELLRNHGYWDNSTFWRPLGNDPTNFSTVGNQQSEAVAALIEKIVNSVDARLMNACQEHGIDPTSPEAPRSMREAVARFFEGKEDPDLTRDGRISAWLDDHATAEGRLLTVSATGPKPRDGDASITISDQGEGQTPASFPDTFLSLHRENKIRIHFVQGKFNMGGTGVLQHRNGPHHLQLIVSRRNPVLLAQGSSERDAQWGFTIVRREHREGARSSVFTYLAPINAEPGRPGEVLSFSSPELPIFPEADTNVRDAYHRPAPYGSLVKLYEYVWKGTRSNIVSAGGGLLRRIDAGLPELTLPVRVFECRPAYRGHAGSFATNALGLAARLDRDRAENLEDGFPLRSTIELRGKTLRVRVYAFRPKKAAEYRRANQGVLFVVNGQTHGTAPIDFFRRKEVGMSYLADSLLVLIDCTEIDAQMREDLFMNSRDRLRDNELSESIERALARLLREEQTLRALRNRRREEELADKLADSQPLATALEDLLRRSPTLANLFLRGSHVSSPFPPATGTGQGEAGVFEGKTYPTYFRFHNLKDGQPLARDAQLGRRVRVTLETDAVDDYFDRDLDRGERRITCRLSGESWQVEDFLMTGPRRGIVNLTLDLPPNLEIGDEVHYTIEVTDPSRIHPFTNDLHLTIRPARKTTSGSGGRRTTSTKGKGTQGATTTLSLPNITEVTESEWEQHDFDELTALAVKHAGNTEGKDAYDFFINVDNKYLRSTQKESKEDPKLLKTKFMYSLTLIGLALLQEDPKAQTDDPDSDQPHSAPDNIEQAIAWTTRALAPVVLPLQEMMSTLEPDS